MAWKTVQIFSPTYPMDFSPDFDRTKHAHLPSVPKLVDLVERGELPRHRGAETKIVRTDDALIVTIAWKSQAVAQEYADWAQSFIGPDNEYLLSVQVIEED